MFPENYTDWYNQVSELLLCLWSYFLCKQCYSCVQCINRQIELQNKHACLLVKIQTVVMQIEAFRRKGKYCDILENGPSALSCSAYRLQSVRLVLYRKEK